MLQGGSLGLLTREFDMQAAPCTTKHDDSILVYEAAPGLINEAIKRALQGVVEFPLTAPPSGYDSGQVYQTFQRCSRSGGYDERHLLRGFLRQALNAIMPTAARN